jgi:Trk-type K+ transport system membrane component
MFLQVVTNQITEVAEKADRAAMLTVFLPLMIWLGLVIIFLLFLLLRFPFAGRKTSRSYINPYKTETMGIPRGVIRGILALTVLVAVVILQIYAIRFFESDTKISSFLTAFEVVLGFYFGAKVVHHIASTDKNKVKAVAGSNKSQEEFNDPDASG